MDKKNLNNEWEEFKEDFTEFAQGPSDFQIEVFMGRGEGPAEVLPQHAYRHMLAQIKPAITELRRLKLDHERLTRKQTKLQDLSDNYIASTVEPRTWEGLVENVDLDLIQVGYDIEDNLIAQKGKKSQYLTMKKMLDHLKKEHGEMTNAKLQLAEPTYWLVRLARQMIDAAEGNATGVGSGNINSLRNAVNGSFVPGSINRLPIMEFNGDLLKEIANGSESAINYVLHKDKEIRQALLANSSTPPALLMPQENPINDSTK